jgi:group II intron reverse transcriptase/maturase
MKITHMEGRKQTMPVETGGFPKEGRTESENTWGAQTFMEISEGSLVVRQPSNERLLELIVSPDNLNAAYKQVKSNGGAGGIDRMDVEALLPYLRAHRDELITSIMDGRYRPNPVRRVEIPKDNGKKRLLGIPTVVDRVIQQAISQVLIAIYDGTFSESSFGFRPHRSAHGALFKVREYVDAGYKECVDLDLEKFFDTVNHSRMIEILSRTIKDGRVISLIHKYLNAGVMVGGEYEASTMGVPQGGPLSPILSNIMLNELDKELERRGHKFVRYADDCMILCKSRKGAERVCKSITDFIERRLKLRINREKTIVDRIHKVKYLGYSFYVRNQRCQFRLQAKTKAKVRANLKELTNRNNGMGYQKRKDELKMFIRGWMEYYKFACGKSFLRTTDAWLRRRIRMCIWHNWKRVRTRCANLMKCGIDFKHAIKYAHTRKGSWCIAKSRMLSTAMTDERLRLAGYPCLTDYSYERLSKR